MIVTLLNAPAGAGKTYTLLAGAARTVTKGNEHVVLAEPTRRLAAEHDSLISQLHPGLPQIRVDQDTSPSQSVLQSSIEAFQRDEAVGGLLLRLTHRGALQFARTPIAQQCHLFLDEVPVQSVRKELRMQKTRGLLIDHLEIVGSAGASYLRIRGGAKAASLLAAAPSDEVAMALRDALQLLTSNEYDLYVSRENFEKFRAGKREGLRLYGLLSPKPYEGFRSNCIAAANLTESLMYRHWSNQAVDLLEGDAGGLRFASHENGALLNIYYAYERDWSKALNNQSEGRAVADICQAAEKLFDGQPCLWASNKADDAAAAHALMLTLFSKPELVTQMPAMSHGLNAYAGFHNLVMTAALNPPSDQWAFFRDVLGVSDEEIRIATTYSSAYQAVLRCSLRDPDNSDRKTIVVPDQGFAEWLAGKFPGCEVKKLDTAWNPSRGRAGRPKQFSDDAARVRHMRAQKALERDSQASREMRALFISTGFCGKDPRNLRGTLFENKFGAGAMPIWLPFDDFVGTLRASATIPVHDKESIELICPALLNPNVAGVTTKMGMANVVTANDLWIDVDDGHLTSDALARMFPKIRMVQFATFSSTKKRPRYRVVIPLSRPVSDPEYEAIYHWLLSTVQSSDVKQHGIDPKLHASDKFKIPCKPKSSAAAYFMDFTQDRGPLEVDMILSAIASAMKPGPVPIRGAVIDPNVDFVLKQFQSVKNNPGEGDRRLFQLGHSLRSKELPLSEIESILMDEASSMNSPRDRTKQVRRIITALGSGSGSK